MSSTNFEQQIKSSIDGYLNNKAAACVDVRHNNRLVLLIIGMLAVFILLLGVFWLWGAPEEQRFIIKIVFTALLGILLLYLMRFAFGNLL